MQPSTSYAHASQAPAAEPLSAAQLPAEARAFLALSPDAALVVDGDGTVLGANGLACELLGYAPDELVGGSVERLVPQSRRAGHAAQRARFAESGRPRPMTHATGLQARRRDGSQVPVDIALRPLASADRPLVLAAIRDMTERERARHELERSRCAYASLLESLPDPVIRYDAGLRRVFANARADEGMDDLPGWRDALEAAIASGREQTLELALPGPLGERWLTTRIVPERDAEGRIVHVLAISRDITERRVVEEQLRERAATDPLTGLPNHGSFHTALDAAVAEARRHGDPLSLVVLDVDRFRAVNEQHGHPLGDEALRGIAGQLRGAVRRGELVGRIGGEEFAWVLPGATLDDARRAAERVRRAVEAAELLPGGARVTVSAGVCELAAAGGSAQRLLALADAALYDAKREGRNRVCVHAPCDRSAAAG